MQITLSMASQAKLEDILEQLMTYHDLEELTKDELLDALLDIGIDLVMSEEPLTAVTRDKLIDYCARKVQGPIT